MPPVPPFSYDSGFRPSLIPCEEKISTSSVPALPFLRPVCLFHPFLRCLRRAWRKPVGVFSAPFDLPRPFLIFFLGPPGAWLPLFPDRFSFEGSTRYRCPSAIERHFSFFRSVSSFSRLFCFPSFLSLGLIRESGAPLDSPSHAEWWFYEC